MPLSRPLNAALTIEGVLRVSSGRLLVVRNTRAGPGPAPSTPIGVERPSAHPKAGWWQVAHATSLVAERTGSKNSRRPSAILAGVIGLSTGSGAASGSAASSIPGGRTLVGAGFSTLAASSTANAGNTTARPIRFARISGLM